MVNKQLIGVFVISLVVSWGLFWYSDATNEEIDNVAHAMVVSQFSPVLQLVQPKVTIKNTLPIEKSAEQRILEEMVAAVEAEVDKSNELPDIDVVLHDVPFTPQAPFGEWDDIRQQDGCEEASLLMAHYWILGASLNAKDARDKIVSIADWEEDTHGYFKDTSAHDTAQLMIDYFNHSGVEVISNPSIASIKEALLEGSIVISPMNGVVLHNPHFNPPGPERHMVLVRGYDDSSREFITNDPGTKHGEAYRYSYKVFMDAIADYPSGDGEPSLERPKNIIVIKPL